MEASAQLGQPPSYATEAAMVDDFLLLLKSGETPWGQLEMATEWDYRTGITDVLARDSAGELIAFEAKLADWRRASHQAYRNTVFATKAYVVMPDKKAALAKRHESMFLKIGVGLLAFSDSKCVRILIEAPSKQALIPWLRADAHSFFDSRNHGEKTSRSSRRSKAGLRQAECHA